MEKQKIKVCFDRLRKKLMTLDKGEWRNDREKKILKVFRRLKRYTKGLKSNTIKAKFQIIFTIEKYFNEAGRSFLLTPERFDFDDFNTYLNEIVGATTNSVRAKHRDEIRWYLYKSKIMGKLERKERSPFFRGVKWINKDSEKSSYIVSYGDIMPLLDSLKNESSKALFKLMYYTASRISESLAIKCGDFFESHDGRYLIRIREIKVSKHKSTKTCVIPGSLFADLQKLRKERNDEDYLFTHYHQTYRSHLKNALVAYFGQSTIEKLSKEFNLSTHIFRVSRAHHLRFEHKLDASSIMKVTNHSCVKTLEKSYTRQQTLDEVHAQLEKIDN